ncbi:MAG: alpha/beta hydrolase [Anaerolineales bacterium]|nr:MAG: alpha/beta hydrolase [Anaerolineales bacterium]
MSHNTQKSFSKVKFLLLITLLLVLLGGSIWVIQWATYARPPLPEALFALESDGLVKVSSEPWLNFSPVPESPETGLIFYPGGRIDPRGYAPLMREISAEGYLVVVPHMPINMAVFKPNLADEIIQAFPEVKLWVIGGHSIGGTMAAQYSSQHPEVISGLVIWASYPANSADLSGTDLPVVSIYGSADPGVNEESITKRQDLLPAGTTYLKIKGGDHHQFGSYEINQEENQARIPRSVQQGLIIQATLDLLDALSH